MLTTLTVVASPAASQCAATAYFRQLVDRARIIARIPGAALSKEEVWALCEYLDCVDARDIDFERMLYRAAVEAVSRYLRKNRGQADWLAQRSWAAATLLEMSREGRRAENEVPRLEEVTLAS